MNLLAFETSTEVMSIAVSRSVGGTVTVWEHTGVGGAQASAHLISQLMALLQQATDHARPQSTQTDHRKLHLYPSRPSRAVPSGVSATGLSHTAPRCQGDRQGYRPGDGGSVHWGTLQNLPDSKTPKPARLVMTFIAARRYIRRA